MTTITKSDFLLYIDAPLHLWAEKHGKIDKTPSEFIVHLMNQGYEVEKLAKEYLEIYVVNHSNSEYLIWQRSFTNQQYELRSDALVYKPNTDSYDLYEIKSSTSVDKENYYDATYQFLIINKEIKIDWLYILHLNKDYIRSSALDLKQLFNAKDITDKVNEYSNEIEIKCKEALVVAQSDKPDGIEPCLKPGDCPCPNLCHPDLPEFSIFDIPRLTEKKKKELINMGILKAEDIPDTFSLNPKQRLIVELARTNEEHIDHKNIQQEMEQFSFPLYFLDYETYLSAIPLFEGYHPQQQMVFQYSLHKIETIGGEPKHEEYLSITKEEPSKPLIEKLPKEIGDTGTVFVWSKPFEISRNTELAAIHPEYAEFLTNLNQRIYDLGDFINLGYYLHPGFKGSWSIKHVLPVMVHELSYEDMEINKGDQAMLTWWRIINGEIPESEIEKTKKDMLKYCELDTLAMVKIWQKLSVF